MYLALTIRKTSRDHYSSSIEYTIIFIEFWTPERESEGLTSEHCETVNPAAGSSYGACITAPAKGGFYAWHVLHLSMHS